MSFASSSFSAPDKEGEEEEGEGGIAKTLFLPTDARAENGNKTETKTGGAALDNLCLKKHEKVTFVWLKDISN